MGEFFLCIRRKQIPILYNLSINILYYCIIKSKINLNLKSDEIKLIHIVFFTFFSF
jgi:hypothetical protein